MPGQKITGVGVIKRVSAVLVPFFFLSTSLSHSALVDLQFALILMPVLTISFASHVRRLYLLLSTRY